jgi:predicted SnoaL-like aldol condensation-catalyzing enzyme
MTAQRAGHKEHHSMTTSRDLAAIAVDTLEGMFNRRDPRVVDERIADKYIQHNPSIPNGAASVRGFIEALAGVQGPIISVKRAIAQGDLAVVHAHYAPLPGPDPTGGRGNAVVDIFRFGPDGKIVEHWDVIQAVPETTASGNDLFTQLS